MRLGLCLVLILSLLHTFAYGQPARLPKAKGCRGRSYSLTHYTKCCKKLTPNGRCAVNAKNILIAKGTYLKTCKRRGKGPVNGVKNCCNYYNQRLRRKEICCATQVFPLSKRGCPKPCGKNGNRYYMKQPCPVDGKWSTWSSWSSCSKTCGGGEKSRRRQCNNPAPRNKGKQCSGKPSTKAKCNVKACPQKVNGKWGAWQSWSSCSKTCGAGTKTRKRYCNKPAPRNGGSGCVGLSSAQAKCQVKACPKPINGKWSAWGSWSKCRGKKRCGTGQKTRHRKCNNPRPRYGGRTCSGKPTDTRTCQMKPCPKKVDGQWGNWGSWSSCSATCGTGTQKRERKCNKPFPRHGGKKCTGKSSEDRPCPNLKPCKKLCGKKKYNPSTHDCCSVKTLSPSDSVYKKQSHKCCPVAGVYSKSLTCPGLPSIMGWLVIQQRSWSAKESTNKTWKEYRNGFSFRNMFWGGLEKVHKLTQTGSWKLRIKVTHNDKSKSTAWLEYPKFSLLNETEDYKLVVSGEVRGTMGDMLSCVRHGESHNMTGFSTWDRPNEETNTNCATTNGGGFWYTKDCENIDLNTDIRDCYAYRQNCTGKATHLTESNILMKLN